MEQVGRQIFRDHMPEQHRELFAKLPYLLVASLDRAGQPWPSILVGPPGFVRSSDPGTLTIRARPHRGDRLRDNLTPGVPVAVLGIELATRRRNRMNGSVIDQDEEEFTVRVEQSFGNCPKYIQARDPVFVRDAEVASEPKTDPQKEGVLSAGAIDMVRRADTLFIASAAPGARGGDAVNGLDISHRGGKPGFVRVAQEGGRTVLTLPDFRGNFLFNTLGNLERNPRAGFLFVDFASGDVLTLAGEAQIIWDGPEVEAFAGAERLLDVRVNDGVWVKHAVPLRWSQPRMARELAATGSWEEVEHAVGEDRH
jgi:predicted pyridoxine 5'-phosphate oxidase superfamily flavin-nucleotide-binding protein